MASVGSVGDSKGIRLLKDISGEICKGCDSTDCRYCHHFKFGKAIDYVMLNGMSVKDAVRETFKEETAAIREANDRCDRELGRYVINVRR